MKKLELQAPFKYGVCDLNSTVELETNIDKNKIKRR